MFISNGVWYICTVKVSGRLVVGSPLEGCAALENVDVIERNIVLLIRGGCMFIDKVCMCLYEYYQEFIIWYYYVTHNHAPTHIYMCYHIHARTRARTHTHAHTHTHTHTHREAVRHSYYVMFT